MKLRIWYLQDDNGTLSARENICNIFAPFHVAAIYNFFAGEDECM
jgi:hypothetical protein